MKPTVSVVIPTYNNSAFLAEAVESVRSQDFENVEIVVVDDGSDDNTTDVLRSLEGDDVHVVRQENAGPAKARNVGISMSHADWIAFLDADDYWLPAKLSAQMDEIRRRPNVGFSYTDVLLHYQNGTEKVESPTEFAADIFNGLLWGNRFATDTVIARRDCLDAVGGFNEGLRTGEDWDLWLRLASRFESIYVPKALTLCRVPAKRIQSNMDMLERCTLSVLDQVFNDSDIAGAHPNVPKMRNQIYAFHYSVLAKSYFHQGRLADCWRMAQSTVRSHRSGWRYLMPTALSNGI